MLKIQFYLIAIYNFKLNNMDEIHQRYQQKILIILILLYFSN
jgi:hypothetical protein